MKVLVACEFTGAVRRAFAARGHHVVSCDLLPAEDGATWGNWRSPIGQHYQGNVLTLLNPKDDEWWQDWDLMIAHPPCTRLTNSGVRWLHEREHLWAELDKAARFFRRLLLAKVPRICIENPRPHKYALERIGYKYNQRVQPWQFGHAEWKEHCFWLKGLPLLVPTKVLSGKNIPHEHRVHRMSPSATRALDRSRTYSGIARAFAQQWG